MVARLAVVATLLTLSSASTVFAQAPQCIAVRLEVQDEAMVAQSREIRTKEGLATMQVQAKRGDQYPTFYLDLAILDRASGLVRVSVRDDRTSDKVIDQFDLQAGAAMFLTGTTPPFKLAVLRVFDRVGSSCNPN